MILPSSIPNKKLVVIDQVLKQCQLGNQIFELKLKSNFLFFVVRTKSNGM
jgi:hypothetical protein